MKKNTILTFSFFCFTGLLIFFSCGGKIKKDPHTLHSFNGKDGATPKGTMTLVGNELYGYTSAGGANGKGVIFKTGSDGNGFSVLYSFTEGADNGTGKEPHHDEMLFYNGVLYGAALYGGEKDNGVIFRINPDGSGYQPIHVFKGGDKNGSQPHSGVIVVNDVIYGMTAQGGTHNNGTLFSINPDGSDFSVLYSFHKSTGDNPHGKPVLGSDGKTFYGITKSGGLNDQGVVFSFGIDDTAFSVLHNFEKGTADGNTSEHGNLVRNGNTLYGMTQDGGVNKKGVVFSINEDGSNFMVMHSFGDKDKDGKYPFGSLKLYDGFLYGTTQDGGENDKGTVFKLAADGSSYETIFSFTKETTGEYPIDNVTIDPSSPVVYCFGQQGGEFDTDGKNKYGTIVRIERDGTGKKK